VLGLINAVQDLARPGRTLAAGRCLDLVSVLEQARGTGSSFRNVSLKWKSTVSGAKARSASFMSLDCRPRATGLSGETLASGAPPNVPESDSELFV